MSIHAPRQNDAEIRDALRRAIKTRLNGDEVVCSHADLIAAVRDLCATERLLAEVSPPPPPPAPPALAACPACGAQALLSRPSGWSSCWNCESVLDPAGRAVS